MQEQGQRPIERGEGRSTRRRCMGKLRARDGTARCTFRSYNLHSFHRQQGPACCARQNLLTLPAVPQPHNGPQAR